MSFPLLLTIIISVDYAQSFDFKTVTISGKGVVNAEDLQAKTVISLIENLVIEEGITGIGQNGFKGLKALINVKMASTIQYIESFGFSECINLPSIVLNEGLLSINSAAFFLDDHLEEITIPSTLQSISTDLVFHSCHALKRFNIPKENSIFSVSDDGRILIVNETIAFSSSGAFEQLRIPSYITELYMQFLRGKSLITDVFFDEPSSLTKIGVNAFTQTSITTLVLPEGLLQIDDSPFSACNLLKSVTFPSSLQTVTRNLLDGFDPDTINTNECAALYVEDGFIYTSDRTSLIFLNKEADSLVLGPDISWISPSALRGCAKMTSFGVDENNRFYSNYSNGLYNGSYKELYAIPGGILETVIAPQCESILNSALSSTKIQKIDMSLSNVNFLDSSAISYCSSLIELKLSNHIKTISSWTFCFSLFRHELVFPSSLETIYDSAFYGCQMTGANFEVCTSLTSITYSAFQECMSMTWVKLPPNLGNISELLFFHTGLTSVTIPASVVAIQNKAFANCESLTTITFSNRSLLTDIHMYAFMNSGITDIHIPNSVTTIYQEAFSGCSKLTEIVFDNDSALTTLYGGVFSGCSSIKKIIFGVNLQNVGGDSLYLMSSLEKFEVAEPNIYLSSKDGVLYNNDFSTLISFPGGLVNFTIDSGVRIIGNSAFYRCEKLESLIFADNCPLSSIGSYTFYGCVKLLQIDIPTNTQEIKDNAFSSCINLQVVTFRNGSLLISLGAGSFNECSALTTVKFPHDAHLQSISSGVFKGCVQLTQFDFPDSLIEIGSNAFYQCTSLKNVKFGQNLTTIGDFAFFGCSSITNVVLPNSLSSIGFDSFRASAVSSVEYCGESDLSLNQSFTGLEHSVHADVCVLYPVTKLGGLAVVYAFDKDCQRASPKFTQAENSSSSLIPLIISSVIYTDAE